MKKHGKYGMLGNCNEDYSKCTLAVDTGGSVFEEHVVDVVWKETDVKVLNVITKAKEKIEEDRNAETDIVSYLVEDLNLLNFYNHLKVKDIMDVQVTDLDVKLVNYSTLLREKFSYAPITITFDLKQGTMLPVYGGGLGGLTLSYNDVIYGMVDKTSFGYNSVIYIDDDTENTKDAYIAAAQKRVDEYFKGTGEEVKVTLGDEADPLYDEYISNYDRFENKDELGDMVNYYYEVSSNNMSMEFLIVKDSSKIPTETSMKTQDINTNVSISTNNANVPLDTTITVDSLDKDDEKFKGVNETLNLGDKDFVSYDLTLRSESTNQDITNIENGEFEVEIPLTDNLKDKNLTAYYVDKDGNKVEYDVVVDGDSAKFKTNHFSIYTLTEKLSNVNENVPNTYDGIGKSLLMGLLGLIGLVGTAVILKDKKVK